jgi:Mn2+/Fe2+ NRAMP family transporter
MLDLPRRPIPKRPPLLSLLGPGLVWMALAQGSGELIWWPYMVAKYGLGFLFLLIPASILQYPVTFEIARYTLLTGEGIFRGFFRLGRIYGGVLWLLFTVSFFWFGAFASAGGTAVAALTHFPAGWSPRGQTLLWAQGSIVVFTVALLWAPVAYKLIEWTMKIVAAVSLLGMVLACLHPAVKDALGAFLVGLFVPDSAQLQRFDPKDSSRLLTAIAFSGLGGFWTLFYSYWAQAKGVGMSLEKALPDESAENPGRLRSWYRSLALETWIGILGNLATTLMTCLLAFALLHPRGLLPDKYDIAVVQSDFFAASWGAPGRILFLIIAASFLADTWLATVDGVARVHLDVLGAVWPGFERRDQRKWYRGLVLGLAAITSLTMYWSEPGPLIVISAVIGFVGTVLYCVGLIFLNHRHLRRQLSPPLRSKPPAIAAICAVTLCYLVLAGVYLKLSLQPH